MKNLIQTCFAITMITGILLAQEPGESDPPELVAARAKYEESKEKAILPIRASYIKYLERIKADLVRSNRLREALAIENEINGLSQSQSPQPAKNDNGQKDGEVLKIDAREATRIGSVVKGQRLRLKYVEGLWKEGGGGFELRSPDTDGKPLIVVGVMADKRSTLWSVPRDTKRRSFSGTFDQDYDEILLVIDDWNPSDNEGNVTYEVRLK